LIAMNLPMP